MFNIMFQYLKARYKQITLKLYLVFIYEKIYTQKYIHIWFDVENV